MRIDKERQQLRECVRNVLNQMKDKNFVSVSIPAISTGIFGFPLDLCCMIMGNTIKDMIDYKPDDFKGKTIIMCNFDSKTTDTFLGLFFKQFESKDSDDEND